ncbi:hypothetical protein RX327_33690 [Bradyrhizobium sp. BEA-2-5]|uniref:hypothetical protein n=1 Tax=Bradyrhizobium sp. BEA-2-5 TaxID=3080015 RepID=UPI00293F4AC6|nr:hypothetical protein [Bradyrhizobium sp. BEA-2-5]WOH80655.1 hypothetical protein RX327_33690 [Bradyrhizobium sp. BEA-2-5]
MDKKAWLKDFASPSNLWTAANWAFPSGTAAVSGWLSYLAHLPPSVILMIALMTAASALVILSEVRKASVYQKLSLEGVASTGWSFDKSDLTGVLSLQADFLSSHPTEIIFYKIEVLSLVLEGVAPRSHEHIGTDIMNVAPNARFGFMLGEIGPLKLGQMEGHFHFRVFYGRSEANLKHELEMKVLLSGVAFIDAQRGPLLRMKWMKDTMRTK